MAQFRYDRRLDGMMDERDHLVIRMNLIANGDSPQTSSAAKSAALEELAALNQEIAARRRLVGA